MKLQYIIFINIFLLITACTEEKALSSSYLAIDGRDTADLKLTIDEKKFHGSYKINYADGEIDSGWVKGIIKGDTLIGHFRYKQSGKAYDKRIPIALLRKYDKTLVLGKGHIASYMNIPYFWEEIPIQYNDPKFTFRPVL